MSNRRTLIKLLVFFAGTALTAVFLGLTLAESRTSGGTESYSAVFADASYLTAGSDVRVAGIPVGSVNSLAVRRDGTVLVVFHVSADTPMPADVRAAVRYKNLIGDRYLELRDGPDPYSPPLRPDGVIPIAHTTPAVDLDTLVGGFRPLFQALSPNQVNQLSGELIAVFQGQSGTVSTLLDSVGSLTSTLADRDQVITDLIHNLNAALGTVDSRDAQLSDLVVQLQQLVSGLAADREPIGQAVTHFNRLAGSAAGLLGDVRPDLRASIGHLGRVSQTLNSHQGELADFLTNLGPIYHRLAGVGTYGDFFNFYLCDIRIKTTGADGQAVYSPWVESNVDRCSGTPTRKAPR